MSKMKGQPRWTGWMTRMSTFEMSGHWYVSDCKGATFYAPVTIPRIDRLTITELDPLKEHMKLQALYSLYNQLTERGVTYVRR